MTEPTHGAWEHWQSGQVTMVPVLYRPGEAWTLINGSWSKVDSSEAAMNATLLDKDAYHSLFPMAKIALPATAFQV